MARAIDQKVPPLGAIESGVNRRQMLTTLATAIVFGPFQSRSKARAAFKLQPPTKPLLTKADFKYLGCMRMPEGVDTQFSYGPLTGRKVGGQLRLFVFGNNPSLHDPIYEVAEPENYSKDYRSAPRMNLVTNWGDVYHGKRVTWINGQETPLGYQIAGGLYWHEANQLLYWTYYDSYNNIVRPDFNLGATSLDNPMTAASRAYGPWRTRCVDGDGKTWYGASRIAGLTMTPDGKMGGFGTYFVTTAAPWGPQLFSGADWPTSASRAGAGAPDVIVPDRYLNYYYMGGQISADTGTFQGRLRSFRRSPTLSYVWHPTNGTATEIDPLKNGGAGSWTSMDAVGGAIWLDLPDKHGVVFAATLAGSTSANPNTCGTGHLWYRNTGLGNALCSHGCHALEIAGFVTDAAVPVFIIYNPADLIKVKNGALTDYSVEPTAVLNLDDFGIKTAAVNVLGHGRAVRGFYFDADRRLLFVRANAADDSVPGAFTDLIHVFSIA